MKRTTLCFVFRDDFLLMIEKKRGQGAGKWNVPGGKLVPGETAAEAAIRETFEETGIKPSAVERVGQLEFHFPSGNSWDNSCEVFICREFSGSLVAENEECSAHWVRVSEIPFDRLWDSDRLWLPLVLSGERFHRAYWFDGEDKVIEEKILG